MSLTLDYLKERGMLHKDSVPPNGRRYKGHMGRVPKGRRSWFLDLLGSNVVEVLTKEGVYDLISTTELRNKKGEETRSW